MLNSSSFSHNDNPKYIQADALTDLSFIKWTSYLNCSNTNLFITASHVSDFIDLYGFDKCGYADKNGSNVKRITKFKALARISAISDAKNGIVAYGCNNGKYGLLEVKSKSDIENLTAIGKLRSVDDSYITSINLKDNYLFIGTQNGKLATENINHSGSKKILTENEIPIKALHAVSAHLCLAGHDCGTVSLWDLRNRQENVLNYSIKKNCRSSYKTIGNVKACHLKDEYLAIIGTSLGNVKFIDMRYATQKYPCVLKVSQKAITSVRFAETSHNIAFVTCFDGFVEIRNDALTSLWFNDSELDVPPWLKGNHYDKLKTSWSRQVKDIVALDTQEDDKIIMGTNGGDLCFILP
jgi:hypothetical protein